MSGYQVMPRLSPDEYAYLEASILEDGVRVPISVAPDGTIIDGHHRDEIARKHALHCPRITEEGDPVKLRGLAFKLNLHRRHLSREQKRELLAESIKADPQLSDREHGRRTGVSPQTATRVRDELEESAQVEHFSERIDPRTGNASQPATKPPRPEPEPTVGQCIHCHATLPLDQLYEGGEGYECDPCVNPDEPTPTCRDCDGYGCETCVPMGDADEDAAPPIDDETHQPKPAPPQQQSRRPALPGLIQSSALEAEKVAFRIRKYSEDDRFSKNAGQIATSTIGTLIRARDALQGVITQLEGHIE